MGSRLRDTVPFLFELFCEISAGNHDGEPTIIRKYPEIFKDEGQLKNIPKFTFPCQLDSSFVQLYSFVLTDLQYTFCFCRYDPRSNTALVLMSHLPWHDIFYKLLNCIANLMNGPEKGELQCFLEACRKRPPMPGHTLTVTYNAGQQKFVCTCPDPDSKLPSIPENHNLMEYFSAVDKKCMVGLWAALLNERRVAIVANKPSRLSACVQAANATLYPMSWEHIFIPILPKHLVECLIAPMPYLIGVPREVMKTVNMQDVGDVVVLDVDENELISPFNDLECLPHELVSNLMKQLSDKNALGDAVSRAFLKAIVYIIGGYRDAVRIEEDHHITFNEEAFVRTRHNMQPFLKKMLQSQIFQQFIDGRLKILNSGYGFNGEFEVECNHFSEKSGDGSGRLKQQYLDWTKNFRTQLKNVKHKANPAVQSAVKSMREKGKHVKSAVRGLKIKMPKTGSRPSSIHTADATDESRYSCSSATPVSSDSSDSSSPSPARAPPTPADLEVVPLDLLTEMDNLLYPTRQDSFPDSSRTSQQSGAEKSKTLPPSCPPRPPQRPHPPSRYPIIPTRKLLDLSDAPKPPPRSVYNSQCVSNITKIKVNGSSDLQQFQPITIRFSEFEKDKASLRLSHSQPLASAGRAGTPPPPPARARPSLSIFKAPPDRRTDRTVATHTPSSTTTRQEPYDSASDLIKLDDSPSSLESFDPLKRRAGAREGAGGPPSADSALLHEYGLDFSQFNLLDVGEPAPPTAATPAAWTTFN